MIYRFFAQFFKFAFIATRPFFGSPGCCRYAVTCSAYAQQQLEREQSVKALLCIAWRVICCSPLGTVWEWLSRR